MSMIPRIAITLFACSVWLAAAVGALAQGRTDAKAAINILSGTEAVVAIDLPETDGPPRRSLSFLTRYAGISGLENRISGLRTFAGDGVEIANRQAGGGVYFADGDIRSASYVVDLKPPADPLLGAHVSWLGCGTGALMLLDLLPSEALDHGSLSVSFGAPDGLYVSAPPEIGRDGVLKNPRDAVFTVLPHSTRRYYASSAGIDFNISVTGDWQFSDARLVKMTSDLLEEYEELFGSGPGGKVSVNMVPVPCSELRDRWRAETRGANVLILSSPATYKNLGEQLAHEQLRHELLHLWIPNALQLEGEYAWFYEGFIYYRALIAGASVGQIRFEDVLRALADVRRGASRAESWRPLAGSDPDRWGSESGTEYSRWVLTAFAADAILFSGPDGGVDGLMRDVFRKGSALGAKRDADEFLLSVMSARSGLDGLVKGSIEGSSPPDWNQILGLAGLAERAGELVPVDRPTRRQRAFLKRLGYNGPR